MIGDDLLEHLITPESALILRKEVTPELVDDIAVDGHLLRPALEFVYSYITTHGEPPSRETFTEETGWVPAEEPSTPVRYLIEKLRENYMRREITLVRKELKHKTPAEIVEIGFREFGRIKAKGMSRQGMLDTTQVENVLERYQERKDRGVGVSFGFPETDEILNGMQPDELYFGLGRPKDGKSWLFCVRPAVEALYKGDSSVIFSLEMSEEEMLDRCASMFSGISWSRFKAGFLADDELEELASAKDVLIQLYERTGAKIHVIQPDIANYTVPAMIQLAQELPDLKAVFIDQLSYIQPLDQTQPNWLQVQEICRALKYATRYWPIMVCAQFNREAANLEEMADLAKIGLSDAVGQTADMLLGLHANQDMKSNGVVTYGVVAARSLGGCPKWQVKNQLSTICNYKLLNRV